PAVDLRAAGHEQKDGSRLVASGEVQEVAVLPVLVADVVGPVARGRAEEDRHRGVREPTRDLGATAPVELGRVVVRVVADRGLDVLLRDDRRGHREREEQEEAGEDGSHAAHPGHERRILRATAGARVRSAPAVPPAPAAAQPKWDGPFGAPARTADWPETKPHPGGLMDRRGFVTTGMAAGLAGLTTGAGVLGRAFRGVPAWATGKTLQDGTIRLSSNENALG